jgi:hypothetical protein
MNAPTFESPRLGPLRVWIGGAVRKLNQQVPAFHNPAGAQPRRTAVLR